MRRKRHEPLPPEALDEPFGPPPEEYRYRCPVCGEEMLVNEAIIDVAVGAAKFRGEYPDYLVEDRSKREREIGTLLEGLEYGKRGVDTITRRTLAHLSYDSGPLAGTTGLRTATGPMVRWGTGGSPCLGRTGPPGGHGYPNRTGQGRPDPLSLSLVRRVQCAPCLS